MITNVIGNQTMIMIRTHLMKSSMNGTDLNWSTRLIMFRIQNSATPLWNLTYEEQLAKKSTIVQEYLKGLEQKIKETK